MGHAMSHSHHAGFSGPPSVAPITSRSGRLLVARFAGLWDFQSDASKVGQTLAAACRSGRPLDDPPALNFAPCFAVVAVTVGK